MSYSYLSRCGDLINYPFFLNPHAGLKKRGYLPRFPFGAKMPDNA
nr:MAG TPA: hypothetical protein [Caudoviricetes sp.]